MANKLKRSTIPTGHTKNDFQCYGPPALKDGQFDGTMICDMGCFKQGECDSNKYYNAAVVQSTINKVWYTYFEYGRTGQSSKPQFQFVECSSKEEAQREYCKQLHSKNDKRGMWVNHPTLGRQLQPKPNKDCYLVRPQATRSTGLPSAKTIVAESEVKVKTTSRKNTIKSAIDTQTASLLRDLNVGTVNYTRSSMADSALPTMSAIMEARMICDEATKVANTLTDDFKHNKELVNLTNMLYGRIPKKKNRKDTNWILTPQNIAMWRQDLDAFESASGAAIDIEEITECPLSAMNLRKLKYVPKNSEKGGFIYDWMKSASKNVHRQYGSLKIKNLWYVERVGDIDKLATAQKRIANNPVPKNAEKPLFQPRKRLDTIDKELYTNSGTHMMFHGTRSVNVTGILRESLRMPKTLSNVVITGSMFGDGLYWADDWRKSAGYTSLRNSYWSGGDGRVKNRNAFMFVCDVALGRPWIAPSSGAYNGPPKGYHSIFGKSGRSGVQNNEFITFNLDTHRLRYLVEFDA